MTLIEQATERFSVVRQTKTNDGHGGTTTTYTDTETFYGALRFDTYNEASKGTSATETGSYTLVTSRAVTLAYHDVIKRHKDGKLFRIIQDGDEQFTPTSAYLDMRTVKCAEWSVTE